jgi:hypothetical protein
MPVSTMTRPSYFNRIQRCERDMSIYREDVEQWKTVPERTERGWAWEDLIARASFLFDRILSLDSDYRDFIFENPSAYNQAHEDKILELGREWVELSHDILAEARPFHDEFGADGFDVLQAKVRRMRSMLIPDDELFDTEEMEHTCRKALQEHEQGLTVPLLSKSVSKK